MSILWWCIYYGLAKPMPGRAYLWFDSETGCWKKKLRVSLVEENRPQLLSPQKPSSSWPSLCNWDVWLRVGEITYWVGTYRTPNKSSTNPFWWRSCMREREIEKVISGCVSGTDAICSELFYLVWKRRRWPPPAVEYGGSLLGRVCIFWFFSFQYDFDVLQQDDGFWFVEVQRVAMNLQLHLPGVGTMWNMNLPSLRHNGQQLHHNSNSNKVQPRPPAM